MCVIFPFSICFPHLFLFLGDLLTCSTNTSISVERNSVYHVWVSLFGHEQIRTQQLTVETAHAQFAKLHALEGCHGKAG